MDTIRQEQLEVLLLDYQMARDDERSVAVIQGTVFTLAVAVVGLIAGATAQTCNFDEGPTGILGAIAANFRTCTEVPDAMLGALPMLPLSMVAFVLLFGAVSTLRSYYLRGLEAEIQALIPQALTGLGDLPPASFVGVSLQVISLRNGRLGYRLLAGTLMVVAIVVFGGLTMYIALHVAQPIRLIMTLVYIPLLVLVGLEAWGATVGGFGLFVRSAERYLDNRQQLPKAYAVPRGGARGGPRKREGRRLSTYLLWPRPEDTAKGMVSVGAFVIAAVTVGDFKRWDQFLAAWLIVELLIYSAHYQWNDARGVVDDVEHSESAARGRLPVYRGVRAAVYWSSAFATARLLLAGVLAVELDLVREVFAATVAVFLVGALYEALRHAPPAPDGGTLAPEGMCFRAGWREWGVWLAVGLGYAIRSAIGFAFASVSLLSTAGLAGLAYFYWLGVLFVLLTWVLDATSYCLDDEQDGGRWRAMLALRRKPHLSALLGLPDGAKDGGADARNRFLRDGPVGLEPLPAGVALKVPLKPRGASGYDEPPSSGHPQSEDVLYSRGATALLEPPGPLATPWNLALVCAVAAASLLGPALSGTTSSARIVEIVGVIAIATTFLITASKTSSRWLAVATGTAAVAVVGLDAGVTQWWAGPIPFAVAGAFYVSYRAATYRSLKEPFERFKATMAALRTKVPATLRHATVGEATWNRMGEEVAASPTDHREPKAGDAGGSVSRPGGGDVVGGLTAPEAASPIRRI